MIMLAKHGKLSSKRDERRSRFIYRARDEKKWRARAEQTGGMYDTPYKNGFDTWRPKGGDNTIRILPPTWDDFEHFGYDMWVHSYVGANNGTYLCPSKMKGKPCPICDFAKEAEDAGEEEETRRLRVQHRVLCWIIDRNEDKPIPRLFSMSWSQDRDIANLCQNTRTGKVLEIDHDEVGFDLTIKRSGEGLKTRYVMIVDRDPTRIDDNPKTMDRILEHIQENPLPSVLAYKDAEYLRKVCEGTAEEKDKDLDEEEEAPRKTKKAKSVKDEEEELPFDPDEDEEASEEEPEDESENEEREAQTYKKTVKRAARNDEEEESSDDGDYSDESVGDDDEEEEEEEEVRPQRTQLKKRTHR